MHARVYELLAGLGAIALFLGLVILAPGLLAMPMLVFFWLAERTQTDPVTLYVLWGLGFVAVLCVTLGIARHRMAQ